MLVTAGAAGPIAGTPAEAEARLGPAHAAGSACSCRRWAGLPRSASDRSMVENLVASLLALNRALGWFAAGLAGLAGLAFVARARPRGSRSSCASGASRRCAPAPPRPCRTRTTAAAPAASSPTSRRLPRAAGDGARAGGLADARRCHHRWPDRLAIAERELLEPLDTPPAGPSPRRRSRFPWSPPSARALSSTSPSCSMPPFGLIRRLAAIYGGRPASSASAAGRNVLSHLAVTGGMAARRQHRAAGARLRPRRAAVGQARRRRAQRPAHRPRRPRRHDGVPPLPFAALAPPAVGDVAGHLFEGKAAGKAEPQSRLPRGVKAGTHEFVIPIQFFHVLG